LASVYCSTEMVVVVTWQPMCRAAYSAKPPQPVPISTTRSAAVSCSCSQMRASLRSEAASSVSSGLAYSAEEYIRSPDRNSEKNGLPRS